MSNIRSGVQNWSGVRIGQAKTRIWCNGHFGKCEGGHKVLDILTYFSYVFQHFLLTET